VTSCDAGHRARCRPIGYAPDPLRHASGACSFFG
jgi:hypothetical protein